MVAGELADLAGETNRAVGEQDLGLADPARVQQDVSRRRVTCRILVANAETERAERDPAGLPAPPHMDDALAIGQQRLEPLAGLRRRGALQPSEKAERSGGDAKVRHGEDPATVWRSGLSLIAGTYLPRAMFATPGRNADPESAIRA